MQEGIRLRRFCTSRHRGRTVSQPISALQRIPHGGLGRAPGGNVPHAEPEDRHLDPVVQLDPRLKRDGHGTNPGAATFEPSRGRSGEREEESAVSQATGVVWAISPPREDGGWRPGLRHAFGESEDEAMAPGPYLQACEGVSVV